MTFRIRYHPLVAQDLEAIAQWIVAYAGPEAATRRLDEIRAAIHRLAYLPNKGSVREDIAPRLRAVPAGRKAVIAFEVDDDAREVLIYTVTYRGADWAARSATRRQGY